MKIILLRIHSGPNYWSIQNQQLIALQVDLDILEKYPTNKICGFYTRLRWLMPSLYNHRCIKGYRGGFLKSVKEGTSLANVVEHIALELQCLAGMDCSFGKTSSTGKPGEYHVVFSYLNAEAGKYAANASINLTSAIINDEPYDLEKDIDELKRLHGKSCFGLTNGSLVEMAKSSHFPVDQHRY